MPVFDSSTRRDAPEAAQQHPVRCVALPLFVAVVGFAVQQTAIVPAVRDVQQSLHAAPEWSSWLVTVYLMVATAATPALGRLGDLHGRRRVLLIGLATFALASAGAAAAPNLLVLRAVQGVGGSVYPLALALARDALPDRLVARTISLLTAAFGLGTAAGFVGGGWVSQYWSWRAIFGIGAGLVLIGLVLTWWLLPDSGDRAAGSYDWLGTILLATGAVSLLAGLTLVVSLGWLAPLTLILLAVSIAASGWWLWHEQHSQDPLVDLHVLARRQVIGANLSAIGLGWALFGSYLLIPKFAQASGQHYGLGASSFLTGVLLLPLALTQTLFAPLSGAATRLPGWLRSALGLLVLAAANVVLALDRHSMTWLVVAAVLLGAGSGFGLQASSSTATEAVADDVAAVSAAVNSTIRRLAGGIGGQVNSILLASLVIAAAQPAFAGFAWGFGVAAGICLAGAAALTFVR